MKYQAGQQDPRAIGAAVARFLDTEEVTGSNPVSPTSTKQPLTSGNAGQGLFVSCACSLRRLARRRAPRAVFDYTDGGAGDELALTRSREAYARIEFRPHVLQDVSCV